MKKRVFLILFLIITPILNAKIYKDSGAFGSLGLTYLSDKYNSSTQATSEQEKFIQEYKLGYKGIIYSPKLLDYSVEGILRYEEIDSKIDGASTDIKSDSQDYKINLNFLKESKMPFRIYAQKSDRPISTVYANTVNRSLQDSQSMGISGTVNLNIFDLTYSASDFSGTYESLLSVEKRDTQTYRTSLRKKEKDYNLQLSYSNIEQILKKEYVGGDKIAQKNTDDDIKLRYSWQISDALRLNTDSYHRINKNTSTDITATSATTFASAYLIWTPKTKHYGSININAFNIKGDYDSTKSISLSQNYGFRITKNLSLTQLASYNIVKSGSMSSQSISLGSGASYRKSISKDTKMNLSLNLNARSNSIDSNTTSNSNTYTYTYDLRTGLTQNINFINTRMNINLGYFGSDSTRDETIERHSASLSLVTTLFSIVKNNLRASYYKDDSKLRYLDEAISRNITRMEIEDTISHASRIGIKGTLRTKVGIRYSNIETDGETIDRLTPKANLNFKYRLGPKLRFSSNFNISKDFTYNIMNYSLDNNLAFNSRYTKISAGYNYNKTVSSGSSEYTEESNRDSHRIQLKFERRF